MRTLQSLLQISLVFCVISGISIATEVKREKLLPMLHGDFILDGDLSDSIWKGALQIDTFYEISPGDNTTPVVRTIAYLGYDAKFLYVAVQCHDPRPEEIRASFADRDSVSIDQDFIQFDIDTKNDEKSSFLFRVNPRGVKGDAVFSEATGVDDFSPDFSFESQTRIGNDGWSAEYRVPLSTLRISASPVQTWGITFFRNYPRQFRRKMTSVPMPRGATCWLCYDTKLTGIQNLPPSRYTLLVPFATAQNESGRNTSDDSHNFNGGLDLKWIPLNRLTVDATLNPDFAQVEADVPQITVNNRFALFYPEKRAFFLEGTDLLNSPLNVMYTRTINDPFWGARTTGRVGDSAYTLLMAEDDGGGSQIIPGPVFSRLVPQTGNSLATIARIRHLFGKYFVGLVFTDRENTGSAFNRVLGPDILWRPNDTNQISAQLLASNTKNSGEDQSNDYALSTQWVYSNPSKFLQVDYQRLGHEFRADNGFLPQVGIERKAGTFQYRFYPNGWLRYIQPGVTVDSIVEIGDRTVSQSTFPSLYLQGTWNSVFNFELHTKEKIRTATRLSDHTFFHYDLQFQPSKLISLLKIKGDIGEQVDVVNERVGNGGRLALSSTIRPGIHLNTELQAERQWLNIENIRLFTADVAQLKVNYFFTPRMFVRVIGQYERIHRNASLYNEPVEEHEGSVTGSILYAYRFNWQTVFYAGYSGDGLLVDGERYRRNSSQFFVKIAYAFEP